MTTDRLYVNGATIEFLNGDDSYTVTVFYRDEIGNPAGSPDKFSFSTAAKLKKFISKTLLETASTEDVAETVGNV